MEVEKVEGQIKEGADALKLKVREREEDTKYATKKSIQRINEKCQGDILGRGSTKEV